MANGSNNGLAVKALFAAVAVIVTMATAWLTMGSNTVKKPELQKLTGTVEVLSSRVQDLTTQLAVLNVEIRHMRDHREENGP